MNRPLTKVIFAFMFLLPALCARAGVQRLLLDGSKEMYWIARVDQDAAGATRTIIQYRTINGASWKRIAQLSQRVASISHRGNQLAVLLESGEWLLIWDGGNTTGTLPDDGSKLQLLAGDGDTFWAIAIAGAGRQPTTAGATQPATSQPAGTKLLYQLDRGRWKMILPLPAEAKEGSLALSAIGDKIMLATLKDGVVHTFVLNQPGLTWDSAGSFNAPPEATNVRFLHDLERPTAWIDGPDAGKWSALSAGWSEPALLLVPSAISRDAVKDITVAGQSIRLVLAADDGKLTEYAFAADGSSRGKSSVPTPAAPPDPQSSEWLSTVAAALLVMVLLSSMRSREQVLPQDVQSLGLRLAPYGRRIAAGLIDALPVIGTLVVLFLRANPDLDESEIVAMEYPVSVAFAVYVLYATVAESLWGWTLGKKIFGLRVVMVDGSPPTATAILLRNVLRLIDAILMLLPLLLIYMLPLRQRAGDVAAETIVIYGDPILPPTDDSIAS